MAGLDHSVYWSDVINQLHTIVSTLEVNTSTDSHKLLTVYATQTFTIVLKSTRHLYIKQH